MHNAIKVFFLFIKYPFEEIEESWCKEEGIDPLRMLEYVES